METKNKNKKERAYVLSLKRTKVLTVMKAERAGK
jgi:hypothetical protein